ncbi:hypothetical protein LF41_434 [Lysobacter dokdonensis DS-58]|uniref:DUF4124 domain-containing protein n=1 Tax=Lysobacter dokdonensis DS-58 TaxID=1300345 RepID=A0A0A2WES0_9GAMM|nr:hypothetical protein [Lysobacter dokdonensis]KGQ18681.1 hypothetical protein LF41_434 [Lysobacter dokdonensis DS-58]
MVRSIVLGVSVVLLHAFMPHAAHAAPPMVQQCVTADGSSVYTDKPCRSIGARTVPMRGELATRLVRERATEARYTGVEVSYITGSAAPGTTTATMRAARASIGRRSMHGGCAPTPTQLAMDLRGAFALGDVNRIAESFHWVGMSQRAANATMSRLQSLTKRNLVDVQYYDAQIGGWTASADAGASASAAGGVMQLQFGEGLHATVEDFDVVRNAGCWFIRF